MAFIPKIPPPAPRKERSLNETEDASAASSHGLAASSLKKDAVPMFITESSSSLGALKEPIINPSIESVELLGDGGAESGAEGSVAGLPPVLSLPVGCAVEPWSLALPAAAARR